MHRTANIVFKHLFLSRNVFSLTYWEYVCLFDPRSLYFNFLSKQIKLQLLIDDNNGLSHSYSKLDSSVLSNCSFDKRYVPK